MGADEEQDEGAIGFRTDIDDGPIEDEPIDEAALRVALNTLDDLLRRVQRIEKHLRIGGA